MSTIIDEPTITITEVCCTGHNDEPCAQDSGLTPPFCCADCPNKIDEFPFPTQSDEIANEPTRAQMRSYRRAQMVSAVRGRLLQIWAYLEKASAGLDELAVPVERFVRARWSALRAYVRRYGHKGDYRAKGRNWNGRTGIHHVIKKQTHVTRSTPMNQRTYADEPSIMPHESAEQWARRISARINNARIINENAEGPLAKE